MGRRPNVALDAGDIDLNFYQHRPFMENASKQKGYRFDIVGVGILQNIGLFPLKHKVSTRSRWAGKSPLRTIRSTGARLLLLQKAGLIKLKDGVGFLGTVDDITENPRN